MLFDRLPTVKKCCYCINLHISVVIIGILETLTYFILFWEEVLYKPDESDKLDVVMKYFFINLYIIGIISAVCLMVGAQLVSKNIILVEFRRAKNINYICSKNQQSNVKLVAVNVYVVFIIFIIYLFVNGNYLLSGDIVLVLSYIFMLSKYMKILNGWH